MYNRLVSKMRLHLGPESLIIYSKHWDYYKINSIKKDNIQIYYDHLVAENPKKSKFNKRYNLLFKLFISKWWNLQG